MRKICASMWERVDYWIGQGAQPFRSGCLAAERSSQGCRKQLALSKRYVAGVALAVSTEKSAEPLMLGRVSGVFGVDGWVKLFSYTEPREAILQYQDCLLQQEGAWNEVHWRAGRRQGKTVVASIGGIDDRDAAEALVGANIGIWRKDLPETTASEFYWADLEGLSVVNAEGRSILARWPI